MASKTEFILTYVENKFLLQSCQKAYLNIFRKKMWAFSDGHWLYSKLGAKHS